METYYFALRARHCQHFENDVFHLERIRREDIGGKIHDYERALAFVRQNPRYVIFKIKGRPGAGCYAGHIHWCTFIEEYEDVTEELRAEVKRRLAAGERV